MEKLSKVNPRCPSTGKPCEGRQELLEWKTALLEMGINYNPAAVHAGEGIGAKVRRFLSELTGNSEQLRVRQAILAFTAEIDKAMEGEPRVACGENFCGAVGTVALAYLDALLPDTLHIRWNPTSNE